MIAFSFWRVRTVRVIPTIKLRLKMRRIRIFAHVSLDGVISPGGPNDNSDFARGGWTTPYRTPAGAVAVAEAQGKNFDLLLGRRTYDLWSGFWPKAPSSPIADGLNAATKYVATHRPESLEWGPFGYVGVDIVESIRSIRSTDGPDLIVWGCTTLTSLLFAQGMVDEVSLCVYPLLLGLGKRFFPDNFDPHKLAFVSTMATPTGVLLNTYRYVGPLPRPPLPTEASAHVTPTPDGFPNLLDEAKP